MKMNEVLPDLADAMDAPAAVKSPKKPQGSVSPSQATQQKQQGQQGSSKSGQHRKSGQQQSPQQSKQQGSQQTAKGLRPGQKVSLPTDQGDEQEFKVTGVTGGTSDKGEIEIENPDGMKDPSQPNRVVYNKSDLEKVIRNRK